MNRGEILKKSRNENKDEDEREKNLRTKTLLPFVIGFCAMSIFFLIFDFIYFKHDLISASVMSPFFFGFTVHTWYVAFSVKRKILNYIEALLITLTFVLTVLNFISEVKKFI